MNSPRERIIELAQTGVPPADIAARLGLRPDQVRGIICYARRSGIQIKRFSGGRPISADNPPAAKPAATIVVGDRILSALERRAEHEGLGASDLARRLLEEALVGTAGSS
ncbi:hypothetical protein [Oceaniglobus trochenteri]|uniref:hypothetical protein n=1 Tax=Oceaniglobus trochenteri TaxID=2763260 RepID=UPI001CFFF94C|nr:hypothetical protein [Oceaniglobus trochenteri]